MFQYLLNCLLNVFGLAAFSANANPLSVSPSPRVNYRGDEHTVDYIPTVDTPAGTVVPFGKGVGVTKLDIKANDLGALYVDGLWDFPKDSATAFAFGAALEWDPTLDSNKGQMKASGGTNVHAYCADPAGSPAGAATVRAILVFG